MYKTTIIYFSEGILPLVLSVGSSNYKLQCSDRQFIYIRCKLFRISGPPSCGRHVSSRPKREIVSILHVFNSFFILLFFNNFAH